MHTLIDNSELGESDSNIGQISIRLRAPCGVSNFESQPWVRVRSWGNKYGSERCRVLIVINIPKVYVVTCMCLSPYGLASSLTSSERKRTTTNTQTHKLHLFAFGPTNTTRPQTTYTIPLPLYHPSSGSSPLSFLMEFKLPVTENHLSLQHDFRFHPLPPTHPLWLYYLPLRSLIAERMLSELPPPCHEVIMPIKGPGYRKTSAKYNISRVLNALDALVLYTPESVVSLRKRHLNELFTTTNHRGNGIADSERKIVHWLRLAEMVHVVHKGTKAACTRAGSAQSSLVTTPKWIETSEESRLADLSEGGALCACIPDFRQG